MICAPAPTAPWAAAASSSGVRGIDGCSAAVREPLSATAKTADVGWTLSCISDREACIEECYALTGCCARLASPRSLKPVLECDRGALTELCREAALTAKSSKLAGARAGNNEPVALHDSALESAGVLEQEGSLAAIELPPYTLDPHEARRAVVTHRLNEPSGALAFDVAAERLGHMYLDEVRALSRLLIWLRLVGLHLDVTRRSAFGCFRHEFLPLFSNRFGSKQNRAPVDSTGLQSLVDPSEDDYPISRCVASKKAEIIETSQSARSIRVR